MPHGDPLDPIGGGPGDPLRSGGGPAGSTTPWPDLGLWGNLARLGLTFFGSQDVSLQSGPRQQQQAGQLREVEPPTGEGGSVGDVPVGEILGTLARIILGAGGPSGGGPIAGEDIPPGGSAIEIPGTDCKIVCGPGGGDVGFGQWDLGSILDTIGAVGEVAIPILQQTGILGGPAPPIVNLGGQALTAPVAGGFGGAGATSAFTEAEGGLLSETGLPPEVLAASSLAAAACPSFFHTTRCGNVVPNKLLQSGNQWWIHAGKPTSWSKASAKKSRRRCSCPR